MDAETRERINQFIHENINTFHAKPWRNLKPSSVSASYRETIVVGLTLDSNGKPASCQAFQPPMRARAFL